MPAYTVKSTFLTPVLLALMVLGISPPGHTEDKAPWVGETLDGKKCSGKSMGFGPYDYLRRGQLTAELDVVETAHFTPEVERLEAGNTSVAINDIAYTITAWPNHHRALHSAMRYRMMFWEWPEDAQVPPAECQLQRAIQFSPQDPVPYMLYGLLLHKAQKYDAALLSFRGALRLRPDDVLTQYNMGLTLVELKQYKEAVQMAKSAYAAGIPLPGLKNKLIAAGQWPAATKTANAPTAKPDVQLQPAKATADKAVKKAEPTMAKKELATGDKQRVEPPVVSQ
jgi:tetratricopeptide (TPR) repeat protein